MTSPVVPGGVWDSPPEPPAPPLGYPAAAPHETADLPEGSDAAAPGRTVVLSLRGVVKEYPGTPPVRALEGVDLDIHDGDLVAVVGPSGSGKSTLLHLMGLLDLPTEGHVEIDGIDAAGLPDSRLSALRAQRIGFVFQQFHLLSGVDAVENVAAGLLYRGVPAAERRLRATAALERVGLGHRLHHKPSQLSGGERQRVAIARALVGDPAIVLADEPTGNLDSRTGAEIVDILAALNAEGTTIVVITHDPDLAAAFPHRVRIADGRVSEDSLDPIGMTP